MVIEINKDIDKYQESIAMGLSAKQLIFSAVSLISGAGLILLLYRYIGLTASAYVAIPVVAPIALGGFYSYNGMSFYEVMRRKIRFAFTNPALVYVSSEGEPIIRAYEQEKANGTKASIGVWKGKRAASVNTENSNERKGNQEQFEAVKKRTMRLLIGCIVVIVLAVAGVFIYKFIR